jgi:hypothetical protein
MVSWMWLSLSVSHARLSAITWSIALISKSNSLSWSMSPVFEECQVYQVEQMVFLFGAHIEVMNEKYRKVLFHQTNHRYFHQDNASNSGTKY